MLCCQLYALRWHFCVNYKFVLVSPKVYPSLLMLLLDKTPNLIKTEKNLNGNSIRAWFSRKPPPLLCKILRRTLNVSCYFARTNVSHMATGSSCMDLAEWFSFFWRTEHLCVNFPFSVRRWARRLPRMTPVVPCWLKHSSWGFWALTRLRSTPFLLVASSWLNNTGLYAHIHRRGKRKGRGWDLFRNGNTHPQN